ncbi:ABC transporter permease subunit [Paenibacillus sp. HWE-109]|uniref:PhnE/PtxC family ABC transporter permease n=1 Tax=Paenibacillus sp. HWE-109 TaxID=1306526 RepID=UPI001EDCA3FD|nr:ABC transporter permease subunit [Paenibacillus sp. HWE-109]UKS28625.1 ABC transporter permease subunit [Paenibacillus sp. HWE-109]
MELHEIAKKTIDGTRGPKGFPDKHIKAKPFSHAALVIQLTLGMLAALSIYGFATFDYKNINLLDSIQSTAVTIKTMFLEPHLKHFTFGEALMQVIITLGLAFLTTLFGAVIALFLALLAARNLSTGTASIIIKAGVTFIRAVPTVLWVLIFAVAAGLGSVAAVIGMTFHSVSYLVKAYSESFEELDKGVIEALKASGATWWQIVFQAVIPSSVTYLISWTFTRFEINFAVAVAMGAAAGAGGIGFDMFMASGFYYDVREVGVVTYFILFFAVLLEILATRIKKKLRAKV